MLGIFVAFPMNLLARFIGFFAGFDHSLKKDKKRIVVCKYKGMGSIIQATPLIATLKKNYPNAEVTFVSSKENKSIIDEIELIDKAFYINDKGFFKLLGSAIKLIFSLIRYKPDLYIDLEIYSNFSSIVTTMSMSRDRFGYYLNTSKYRMGLYTHMMYFNPSAPITETYLQFARLLKCEEIIQTTYSFESENSAPANSTHIVINPNASDLRLERRWLREDFTLLISAIRKKYPDREIYLIGSGSESDYVHEVAKKYSTDSLVKDVSGKTNIKELLELIRTSSLVITNDTGPMHIASAMKKQTIALFGPCSPSQYAIGDHVHVMYKNLYCSPCVHEFIVPPCKGDNQCMKQIEVLEVEKKIDAVFSGQKSEGRLDEKSYQSLEKTALGQVMRK